MLDKASRLILIAILLLSAVGLILNQKEATLYLVESGLCNWQFGRLLVFFLPGFIIIPSIILGFNLKGKKVALGMMFMTLLVFAFDLLNYSGVEQDQLLNVHPLINAFDGSALWMGTHAYLLILAAVCAGIQWGTQVKQKDTPIFIYLFFLPIFAVSLVDFPLYDTDFRAHQEKIPEGASHDNFNSFFDQELPDNYALFVFSTGCGTCEETAKLVATTMRGHETIPIYMMFNAREKDIENFIETSHCKAPYHNLDNVNDFFKFTEGHVPKGYLVENGEIVDSREGFFINYQFLDGLIE